MRLDISEIVHDFPEFRVVGVLVTGALIVSERSHELDVDIVRRENDFRIKWATTELSQIPGVAAWRTAYRAFGIKKASYRCSVERLAKNVQAMQSLPAINTFVDIYNAVSLTHVMPAGADDLAHISGDLAFRYARTDDDFRDMAARDEAGEPMRDPPKAGEVVYADGSKVLCRRWNWRQDARSLVGPHTTRAVVTIQSNGIGDLTAAAADLTALLKRHCGGTTVIAVADRMTPVVTLTDDAVVA